ncbi:MAG: electron transfer flavoprotein subunit alpha [Betaproteobacteria bacterium TMED82]|nr:MAG: electron transfer flavoprotein subunit alpha [Betaproteobacteria bacterium TMED82]|tara:strand:- start:390 stop:1337 length:948 start_codon:yes stop_codon:yes gene_type:complete
MVTLVIVENSTDAPKKETFHVITAAKLMESDIWAVVLGKDCHNICKAVSTISGVKKVIKIDAEFLKEKLSESYAFQISNLLKAYREIKSVLISTSSFGKELLPRIAAMHGMSQVSDVIKIHSPSIFDRPIYAGNLISKVKTSEKIKFLTIRTTKFDAAKKTEEVGINIENFTADTFSSLKSIINSSSVTSDKPDLLSARVVVAGGRGLGSAENYKKILEPLALKLNAALGASRAAVDSGFAPNEYQVGQTGKVVAPELYFAIGMSGSVQHLAGMKDSKIIVAINKDEDAPIFRIATYGLVADLFDVVPEITKKIR